MTQSLSGAPIGATTAVGAKSPPTLEGINTLINSNNDLLQTLISDVQSFVARANGDNLQTKLEADSPTPSGVLNTIIDNLSGQSRRIQELRDAVNHLPDIA